MATTLTDDRSMSHEASRPPKRRWVPWYRLPVVPLCPTCDIPCIAAGTRTIADGRITLQHRKCPECGFLVKTTYTRE